MSFPKKELEPNLKRYKGLQMHKLHGPLPNYTVSLDLRHVTDESSRILQTFPRLPRSLKEYLLDDNIITAFIQLKKKGFVNPQS